MIELSNSELSISVSPQGAELCSIKRGNTEYLWQADPTYWKRHSPVLFPIVGSVWDNTFHIQGKAFQMSQHGFARDKTFELISHSDNEVWFRLKEDKETLAKYPFAFNLEIGYHLHQNTIDVMWKVTNPNEEEMPFQIGAHPAFYYPGFDALQESRGFIRFDHNTPLSYILIGEKGCADTEHRYPLKTDDNLWPIDTHTFDKDALIFEDSIVKGVTLYTPGKEPYLTLRFTTPLVGIWSPPQKNAPFICIEPWYGRCDRIQFTGEYRDKDWMQILAPHSTFNGGYQIEIH